jgi:hypothetical protein
MALKVEGIVYGGVHADEALGGSSRFEALPGAPAPTADLRVEVLPVPPVAHQGYSKGKSGGLF